MDAAERSRVSLGQLPPQRHQPADVVRVVVCENDIGDRGEIDAEGFCVAQHGLGVVAGVDENAAAVDFEERRESPLTDAATMIT
jgi:hypothetical protein